MGGKSHVDFTVCACKFPFQAVNRGKFCSLLRKVDL